MRNFEKDYDNIVTSLGRICDSWADLSLKVTNGEITPNKAVAMFDMYMLPIVLISAALVAESKKRNNQPDTDKLVNEFRQQLGILPEVDEPER